MQFQIVIRVLYLHIFNLATVTLINSLESHECNEKIMTNEEPSLKLEDTSNNFIYKVTDKKFDELFMNEMKKYKEIIRSNEFTTSDLHKISNILTEDIVKPLVEGTHECYKFINKEDAYYFIKQITKPDIDYTDNFNQSINCFYGSKKKYVKLSDLCNFLKETKLEIEPKYLDSLITVWSYTRLIIAQPQLLLS
ncbi:uncharacterized protein LOC126896778 [Daktulosphaira vitifoliae]|uniref:uncharacterized protein LOC126896778 n=1 Tax=Daktulosphaira vitifoliae TaxID=58002 RepID=UPI0021AACE15|nr:uncharacterized protein LOC126896778 [Daktulosphaira vitifoliae]